MVGESFKDREVHLIKTAWGGKSLFKDFRPPSSKGETGKYYTKMVDEIRAGLADFGPDGYELGGFVWMQGWNDMVSQEATAEYSKNLVNFVADLRKEFSLRNLPFVVGELGNGGEAKPNSGMAKFREAQNEGVKKTPLLITSELSLKYNVPVRINYQMIKLDTTAIKYSAKPYQIMAAMLEGIVGKYGCANLCSSYRPTVYSTSSCA